MPQVKNMMAAILVEPNQPLVVDQVELPSELTWGQVLVKVHYSGICGSQLGEITGVKGPDAYLPHLLGHEGGGEVVETGPGVQKVKQGDYVVMHWRKGTGIESCPPVYRWQGRRLNAGWVTTFNEFAIVSENRLTAWPSGEPLSLAPLFGCALTTGLGVICNNAALKIGQSIALFGAGGIGLSMVQGAALATAYPIIAVDLFDNRLALARKLGATHVLNALKCNLPDAIRDIVGPQGVDVSVDNTGAPEIIELAYKITHPQGRLVLVGVPPFDHDIQIHSLPLHFGKVITGSHGGEAIPEVDIPRYLRLYQAGRIDLQGLVTDHFKLHNINLAIEGMRSGKVSGRCLIDFMDD